MGIKKNRKIREGGILTLLNNADRIFVFLFCIYIFVTLIVNVFIDCRVYKHYPPNYLTVPNYKLIGFSFLLFLLSVTAVVAFKYLQNSKVLPKISDKRFYIFIFAVFAAVYVLQLFISKHIYGFFTWDAERVRLTAEDIAFGKTDGLQKDYFSAYPNNIFLAYTLVLFYKIGILIHPVNPYAALLAFSAFCVWLSVLLAVICVYRLTANRAVTVISMLAGIVMIALSPHIVVPYSDTIGMLFPITAMFIYIYVKNCYIKYPLVFFVCLIGYYYKPTVFIILIALIIIKAIRFIYSLTVKNQIDIKCILICTLLITASVIASVAVKSAVFSLNKTELDEQKRYTITHFIMLGLNSKTEGVYSPDDDGFSYNMPDLKTREHENLRVAKERLKEMKTTGFIKLLVKKNLNNYNDGTFASLRAGLGISPAENNSNSAKLLRNLYYTDGKNYQAFAGTEQVIWLFVLISIIFSFLCNKRTLSAESLVSLSLIGVSIFLLLFECRARYLFLFSPLYLILAATGIYKLGEYIYSKIKSGGPENRIYK